MCVSSISDPSFSSSFPLTLDRISVFGSSLIIEGTAVALSLLVADLLITDGLFFIGGIASSLEFPSLLSFTELTNASTSGFRAEAVNSSVSPSARNLILYF